MEKRATEAELKIAKLEAQLEAARFQAEKDVAVAEERAMAAEQRANAAELMHKSNAELMAKIDSNIKVRQCEHSQLRFTGQPTTSGKIPHDVQHIRALNHFRNQLACSSRPPYTRQNQAMEAMKLSTDHAPVSTAPATTMSKLDQDIEELVSRSHSLQAARSHSADKPPRRRARSHPPRLPRPSTRETSPHILFRWTTHQSTISGQPPGQRS